jgi:hypothetical protein
MGSPTPTTNFVGLTTTLHETQRKAAINSPYHSDRDARELENWLEAQPQRFAVLGINADTYNVIVWVTSQFLGPLNGWWLNCMQHVAIRYSFDTLVEEIRKTSFLPNICDGATNSVLGLTQGNLSYAEYTAFQPLFTKVMSTSHTLSVRFIIGLADFQLATQAMSHRSQHKGYCLPLMELQCF